MSESYELVEAACHCPFGSLKWQCCLLLLRRLNRVNSPRNNEIVLGLAGPNAVWKKVLKVLQVERLVTKRLPV
jgi:hypothetical protein